MSCAVRWAQITLDDVDGWLKIICSVCSGLNIMDTSVVSVVKV